MVMTDALDAFWLRSLTYRSCYMFVRGNQDRSLDICAAVQLTGASATQYAYKAILQDAGESALLVAKVQDFGGAAVCQALARNRPLCAFIIHCMT